MRARPYLHVVVLSMRCNSDPNLEQTAGQSSGLIPLFFLLSPLLLQTNKMVAAARKPWVGGNWKCNGSVASTKALCEALNKAQFDKNEIDVIICPPALHMSSARTLLDERFNVCAQNVSKTGNGAYTGEVSVEMLKDAGYVWTLVGHSERRQYYGETDCVVAAKTEACQRGCINVAVCIGELLEQRKNGEMKNVLMKQMEAVIPKVTDWSRVVIAYEPVWAIGTGVVATPEQAKEAHEIVRGMLREKVGESVAASVRIVYGGSVNEKNCATLINMPDIDGFLVGGASLKPEFCEIIQCAITKAK